MTPEELELIHMRARLARQEQAVEKLQWWVTHSQDDVRCRRDADAALFRQENLAFYVFTDFRLWGASVVRGRALINQDSTTAGSYYWAGLAQMCYTDFIVHKERGVQLVQQHLTTMLGDRAPVVIEDQERGIWRLRMEFKPETSDLEAKTLIEMPNLSLSYSRNPFDFKYASRGQLNEMLATVQYLGTLLPYHVNHVWHSERLNHIHLERG